MTVCHLRKCEYEEDQEALQTKLSNLTDDLRRVQVTAARVDNATANTIPAKLDALGERLGRIEAALVLLLEKP